MPMWIAKSPAMSKTVASLSSKSALSLVNFNCH